MFAQQGRGGDDWGYAACSCEWGWQRRRLAQPCFTCQTTSYRSGLSQHAGNPGELLSRGQPSCRPMCDQAVSWGAAQHHEIVLCRGYTLQHSASNFAHKAHVLRLRVPPPVRTWTQRCGWTCASYTAALNAHVRRNACWGHSDLCEGQVPAAERLPGPTWHVHCCHYNVCITTSMLQQTRLSAHCQEGSLLRTAPQLGSTHGSIHRHGIQVGTRTVLT
jgi:hypothetical protein